MGLAVARLGFELELFPYNDSNEDEGPYCDECEEYVSECGCEDECCSSLVARWRRTSANEAGGMVGNALLVGGRHGITPPGQTWLHDYHCDCPDCRYDRPPDSHLMAAQEDSTVGAEFVSRILRGDRTDLVQALSPLDAHYSDILGGWMPDGYDSCGNHVHVGIPQRHIQHVALWSNVLLAEHVPAWEQIASGGCGQLRGYNGPPTPLRDVRWTRVMNTGGSWITPRHSTVEYRLWNTPQSVEFIHAHVALSAALATWSLTMPTAESRDQVEAVIARAAPAARKQLHALLREWPDPVGSTLASDLLSEHLPA